MEETEIISGAQPCPVGLSAQTLELFKELLDQVAISPRQPDFDQAYQRISLAKRELDGALAVVRRG